MHPMTDLTARADAAQVLETLAAQTGNRHIAMAAKVLRALVGRPSIDDALALADVAALLDSGKVRSVRRAARMVARAIAAEGESVTTIAERLRVKYRASMKKVGRKSFSSQRQVATCVVTNTPE